MLLLRMKLRCSSAYIAIGRISIAPMQWALGLPALSMPVFAYIRPVGATGPLPPPYRWLPKGCRCGRGSSRGWLLIDSVRLRSSCSLDVRSARRACSGVYLGLCVFEASALVSARFAATCQRAALPNALRVERRLHQQQYGDAIHSNNFRTCNSCMWQEAAVPSCVAPRALVCGGPEDCFPSCGHIGGPGTSPCHVPVCGMLFGASLLELYVKLRRSLVCRTVRAGIAGRLRWQRHYLMQRVQLVRLGASFRHQA